MKTFEFESAKSTFSSPIKIELETVLSSVVFHVGVTVISLVLILSIVVSYVVIRIKYTGDETSRSTANLFDSSPTVMDASSAVYPHTSTSKGNFDYMESENRSNMMCALLQTNNECHTNEYIQQNQNLKYCTSAQFRSRSGGFHIPVDNPVCNNSDGVVNINRQKSKYTTLNGDGDAAQVLAHYQFNSEATRANHEYIRQHDVVKHAKGCFDESTLNEVTMIKNMPQITDNTTFNNGQYNFTGPRSSFYTYDVGGAQNTNMDQHAKKKQTVHYATVKPCFGRNVEKQRRHKKIRPFSQQFTDTMGRRNRRVMSKLKDLENATRNETQYLKNCDDTQFAKNASNMKSSLSLNF